MSNPIEESANKIYAVLEEELRGKSVEHAKAVISAVLVRIGRVTMRDGGEQISVRASTASELAGKLLSAIKAIEKRDGELSDKLASLAEKVSGVRDTIRQTNVVTQKQQAFLMSVSRDVSKAVRGAR